MALFGGGRRRNLLDDFPAYATPGIGDGVKADAPAANRSGWPGWSGSANRRGGGMESLLPITQGMRQFEPTLPDFQVGERAPDPVTPPTAQVDPAVQAMVGQAPVQRKGGLRDVLAGGLAVLGDAFAQNNGQRGFAVNNLAKTWGDRRESYDNALQAFQGRQRIASLPGMTVREMAAYMADPKAWGSHMADAATSRYQAATLNPGDQRFLGDGNGVYQAPTRGQQYAEALGYTPGTEAWNNAVRDQELGTNGPTAFGNQQTLGDMQHQRALAMERLRQQGRVGMESMRQGNRVNLRGLPTYRDTNPPPRNSGGRENLPVVRSPEEAKRLPSGSRFKTPDGRVMQVP